MKSTKLTMCLVKFGVQKLKRHILDCVIYRLYTPFNNTKKSNNMCMKDLCVLSHRKVVIILLGLYLFNTNTLINICQIKQIYYAYDALIKHTKFCHSAIFTSIQLAP